MSAVLAALEGRIRRTDGCWFWTGPTTTVGYGVASYAGRLRLVHRLYYAEAVGPVPEGMQLDHLCHNADESCEGGTTCLHRRCLNPAHLEPVLPRTNAKRGRNGQIGAAHPRSLTPAQIQEARAMRLSGATLRQMADAFGVSSTAVGSYVGDLPHANRKGLPKSFTDEQVATMRRLRAEGMSQREVAAALGCSKTSVKVYAS